MRVYQEAHRLVGDRLHLLQHHARRLRRDMRIHHHHIVSVDDDSGVRAGVDDAGPDGAVDAWDDLLEAVRGLRRRRLRVEREAADRDEREHEGKSSAGHGAELYGDMTYNAELAE